MSTSPSADAGRGPVAATTRSRPRCVERFEGAVFHASHGQPVVYLDRAHWADAATFLRDEQQFTMLLDVTAVDHLLDVERIAIAGVTPERFEVVANYLSHPRNRRIRLIAEVPADDTDGRRASRRSTAARTSPSARSTTCSGSRSTVTRTSPASSCPTTGSGHPLRKDDSPARVPGHVQGRPGPAMSAAWSGHEVRSVERPRAAERER